MRFKYKKFKINDGLTSCVLRPTLMVKLNNVQNKLKGVTVEALIDSGADRCLINSRYAEVLLNEDYKHCPKGMTRGIAGDAVDIYFHDVEIEIPTDPETKFTIPFGFVKSNNFNVLLGQNGFFDKFKISFNLINNYFEIELNETSN